MILGEGAVGKSAITIKFVRKLFIEEYDPTIEDSYQKTFTVPLKKSSSSSPKSSPKRKGAKKDLDEEQTKTVTMDLLDTAGQEEYSAMRESYMYDGESFVLVFAKNNRDSFESLIDFAELISRVRDTDIKNVPVVVCGNKNDLPEEEIEVSDAEGESFAERLGAEYVSVSALTGNNINAIFENVVHRVEDVRARELEEESQTSSGKGKKSRRRRLRMVDGTCKLL